MENPPEPPPPPSSLADHELLRPIGEGSYGVVWLARNLVGSYRAIKIIHRSKFTEERPYEREFEGMERFEPVARTHPGLVALLHLGQAPDKSYFYYIMEAADDVSSGPGQKFDPKRYTPHTLSAELARRGRLPFDECIRIGIALSLALDHLHTRRLVHRDIKPSNIIFVNGAPKLADIGLVAAMDDPRSDVGTQNYYPPGPERGTARADIFSFGKVLYQMATGRSVEAYPELPSHLRDESVPDMFLINQIVLKACDPEPRARYQSAAELHRALVAARDAAAAAHAGVRPAETATTVVIDPAKKAQPKRRPAAAFRVTILYKPSPEPDNHVRDLLKTQLGERQCEVLADESPVFQVQNVREMEDNIHHSDAVVVLISDASYLSELLAYEVELARDAGLKNHRPVLLPVFLNFTETLQSPLSALLGDCQRFEWKTPQDDERIIREIFAALQSTPEPSPTAGRAPSLEPATGAVPLTSPYYVERDTDRQFMQAIHRHDSIVLIKGARQMGKTSLLARGLAEAKNNGYRMVVTDFQKFRSSDLVSVDAFYRALADFLAAGLKLSALPDAGWDNRRNPTISFERYLGEVLANLPMPLIWGMDEVDRLFACDFGNEVFGLFRSWHNDRSTNPSVPWSRMTLAIAYATEAHLFITDVNQSPFNVGTRVDLEDFTLSQIEELNGRYGSILKHEKDIVRLHKLLGGHPYLLRQAFNGLVEGRMNLETMIATADHDNGIFADHLRRIVVLLARDPELTDVMRGILRGRSCPDAASFHRLSSAGLIRGDSFQKVDIRCELYASYLRRHLL